MDIEANMKEQLDIANDVMQIWDRAPESGRFSWIDSDNLAYAAYRLSELIQAAYEHKKNRKVTA